MERVSISSDIACQVQSRSGQVSFAKESLNRSRNPTLVTIVTSAVRNADGNWLLTSSDGRTCQIDPDFEASALLTRDGYVKAAEAQHGRAGPDLPLPEVIDDAPAATVRH